jgi:hypothetical protein
MGSSIGGGDNRRTSVYTNTSGGRQQNQLNQTMPVVKPRKPEAKVINLQRLGSAMPVIDGNAANESSTTNRTRLILINSTVNEPTIARPKTSNRSSLPKASLSGPSGITAMGAVVKLRQNVGLDPSSTSKANVEHAVAAFSHYNSGGGGVNPELSIAATLAQINASTNTNSAQNGGEVNENGLSEFTLQRILKWLEDMEKCTSMIKPPSQLVWSESGMQSKRSRGNHTSHHNNHTHLLNTNSHGGNDFGLSDYDSFDEEVVEYNRVVDKTFHIVHTEE